MNTQQANAILMHHHDGSVTKFTPSEHGLYKHALSNNKSIVGFWLCSQTVTERQDHYTQRDIQAANQARRFQNIIMLPCNRELMDVSIEHLVNCPITRRAIRVAQDIYGPNLGSLKGKTVWWTLPHLPSSVDPIPPDLLERHPSMTIVMDILFINNIPLLLSMSRGLKFMTIEVLPDRQIKTIRDKVWTICRLYQDRGIGVDSIFADAEFDPSDQTFRSSAHLMPTTINLTSNEQSEL